MTKFCSRLKRARLKAGYTQKELGIAIGFKETVASARMNQYETGKHEPSLRLLVKIAKKLKVKVGYFFDE